MTQEDTSLPQQSEAPENARAGRVAIVGRPNVGKSTLLNALLRMKLVIATPRPGTTRSAVLGVFGSEDPPTQIAFVDTPGIARARTALHKVLVEQAELGLTDCDAVLFITEPPIKKGKSIKPGVHPGDEEVFKALEGVNAPVILAVNKVDALHDKRWLLPHIEAYQARHNFDAVVPLSALKRKNLEPLLKELRERLPEGLLYEDFDYLTDRPQRFFVAELIREAVIGMTRQEVPYGAAVIIDRYEDDGPLTRIVATVVVEKDSHKGIVIGKGGSMIKEIGIRARTAVSSFIERKVHLELHVKVIPGWTADPVRARKLATEADL